MYAINNKYYIIYTDIYILIYTCMYTEIYVLIYTYMYCDAFGGTVSRAMTRPRGETSGMVLPGRGASYLLLFDICY